VRVRPRLLVRPHTTAGFTQEVLDRRAGEHRGKRPSRCPQLSHESHDGCAMATAIVPDHHCDGESVCRTPPYATPTPIEPAAPRGCRRTVGAVRYNPAAHAQPVYLRTHGSVTGCEGAERHRRLLSVRQLRTTVVRRQGAARGTPRAAAHPCSRQNPVQESESVKGGGGLTSALPTDDVRARPACSSRLGITTPARRGPKAGWAGDRAPIRGGR